MSKVLLVYEDYADLMSVEATLKKVGFDVIGLSSEYAISDQIISFNPDVVVGSGKGAKVSSLGVGKRLKEMSRWGGKSVLIFPANFKPAPQDLIKIRVDMILESPVAPLRIVQVLAKLLGQDEGALLERLNKAVHVEAPGVKPGSSSAAGGGVKFATDNEAIFVKGTSPEDQESPSGVGFNIEQESEGEGADFTLNNEEEKEIPRFKFGAKFQTADQDAGTEAAVGNEFPDVDLKALERELLGQPSSPEVEKVQEKPAPTEPPPAVEEAPSKARQDLEKFSAKLAERMQKYAKLVEDVKVAPVSTISRVESRKRQIDIASEWDQESIKDLDKLRQDFTKALFKK